MQRIQATRSDHGVLTLCMNRPEVHNAFDAEMIREFTEALQHAEGDNAVRLVIVRGAGPCFSAGADLNWMRGLIGASHDENVEDALRLARLIRTLNYLSKPTIACVNGAAFGGGVGLIAACDVSVASDSARFALTEVRLGLAPAVISPYVLRRIGESHARRYFVSGEQFDADTAMRIGLIQQHVPARDLDTAVMQVVANILKGGPEAVIACKGLVRKIAGHTREEQERLDAETARLIARLRVSDEGQEGLTAFLDKRKPNWQDG